jgi:Domain of unknown function (DUF4332)/Zinc dependent phospholipase C
MNLLLHIVYAAHAKGTHHKLALDALRHLKCAQAELWQRLFLANAELYLDGSNAPDTAFKDFKNHVLHPREAYWGGAPEQARSWYQHLTDTLAQGDWQTAVYCAGVLSHYYTDPLQPLHTGQSEAENNIHRALEWSISRAYGELRALGETELTSPDVVIPPGDNWLAELVCAGAEMSNRYYEKLLAHYDIARGVVDPPAGLDRVAKRIVAERLRYAYVSYAAVLDRAITEAAVAPPEMSLTVPTLLAAVQIPIKVLARRMANSQEQRLIERMYDELIATGTVEQHLPEDDRTLRDLHAREIRSKLPLPQPSQVFPFKPREPAVVRNVQGRTVSGGRLAPEQIAIAKDNVVALRTQAHATSDPAQRQVPALKAIPVRDPTRPGDEKNETPAASQMAFAPAMPHLSKRLAAVTVAPLRAHDAPQEVARAAAVPEPRFHLTLDQDVVDGPAIGPMTAEHLYPLGIRTVRDLLKAGPAALAVLVDARHITPQAIADWQDQARLVCMVPGLRGTHAQLLVGAGYRSADDIAAAEAGALCADVLAFAASTAGQRLLRNGNPPDIEKIKGWLDAAQSIMAA